MSTFRALHKKKYFCMSNALAQNNSLSLRARGLMAFFLSLPDDWEVSTAHLCSIMKEGREQIQTIIRELIDAGYIYRWKEFQGKDQYIISEISKTKEEFNKSLQRNGFSVRLESNPIGNPHLQSTNTHSTEEKEKAAADYPPTTQDQNEGQVASTHVKEKSQRDTPAPPEKVRTMEDQLRSSSASPAAAVHAIAFMKSTDEWRDKENPLGFLIKAGRERWPLRKDTKSMVNKHKKEAQEICQKARGKLLPGVNMHLSSEEWIIESGMSRYTIPFKLNENTWKEKRDQHLERMNLK